MTKSERFAALVSEVAREVMRRRSSDACCGELTLEQFETLRTIDGFERSSIGSLSATMGVDLSTMSRNVTVLERSGYLQRAKSADDGRIVHVKLLSKGRTALTTLRCGEKDVLGDLYEQIPSKERSTIVKALASLRSCLTASDSAAACCSAVTPTRRAS